MLQAETQFRKVVGYSDLAKLALAAERDLAAQCGPIHTTPRRTCLSLSPCTDNLAFGMHITTLGCGQS